MTLMMMSGRRGIAASLTKITSLVIIRTARREGSTEGSTGKRFLVVGVMMCVHAAKAFRVDLLAIAICSVECVDGFEPSNSFTSDEFCSQVSLEETLRIRRGS